MPPKKKGIYDLVIQVGALPSTPRDKRSQAPSSKVLVKFPIPCHKHDRTFIYIIPFPGMAGKPITIFSSVKIIGHFDIEVL